MNRNPLRATYEGDKDDPLIEHMRKACYSREPIELLGRKFFVVGFFWDARKRPQATAHILEAIPL
jgi:hypothetical protein